MRRAAMVLAVALQCWGCSSSGGSSSGGTTGGTSCTGSAALATDLTALDFGADLGSAVFVGTSVINTVQLFNSGAGSISITGVTVGTGATTFTQQLPGVGGVDAGLVTTVITTDNTHPEFFTATAASATSVTCSSHAAVQVTFTPTIQGFFTASLTIASSAGNVTLGLAGDAVTGIIGTCDGKSSYTLPTVYLKRYAAHYMDGGPYFVDNADGGPQYLEGDGRFEIPICNFGSTSITLDPPMLSVSGDNTDWFLCQNPNFTIPTCATYDATTCPVPCLTGPFPNNLPAASPDGGPAVSPHIDGGISDTAGFVIVDLRPAVVGSFTQTISIGSTATNLDGGTLVVTVNGTAVPQPDGG